MRAAAGILSGLLLLLAGSSAAADEPAGRPPERAGIYARGSAGVGYASGSYRYDAPSSPALPPVRELHFDVTLHGPLLDARAALGHAVTKGVAIAAEAGASLQGIPAGHARLGSTNIDVVLLARAGVVVDVYPAPDQGTHILGGLAFARATFLGGRNHDVSFDNVVHLEPAHGPEFYAGPAFDFEPGFGLGLRFFYGRLAGDRSQYRPLGVMLQASWISF